MPGNRDGVPLHLSLVGRIFLSVELVMCRPHPLAPLQEKRTSGTEIRRTPDVKLRFVGVRRFVDFNFG